MKVAFKQKIAKINPSAKDSWEGSEERSRKPNEKFLSSLKKDPTNQSKAEQNAQERQN